MYPQGDSLQGVSDLAGNVEEWCRNKHRDPRHSEPSGAEDVVLRGGSWSRGQAFARAGFRYHSRPGGRRNYIGFRVVCSSPIR